MNVNPSLSLPAWTFLSNHTKGGISPDVTAILREQSAQLPTQALIQLALTTADTKDPSHQKISLEFQKFLELSTQKLHDDSFTIRKPWGNSLLESKHIEATAHLDLLLSSLLILSKLKK